MGQHRIAPAASRDAVAQEAHAALVAGLRHALAAATPGSEVVLIETHISSVLLAGEAAYKLKKPVDFGFLDFTTLAARKRYCELELALNRRTAPQLYLEVVPITGSADAPRLGGPGVVLDYAVKMRRFDTEAGFDRLLARGALDGALVDALADRVAAFHAAIDIAPANSAFGTAKAIVADALDNFAHIERLGAPAASREALARLRRWTEAEGNALHDAFVRRKAQGFVRECHGDLHLGNVARIDGAPVPFDCIEFNADFRWIDVMSEIAFTVMDFVDRGATPFAWRFLNRVLETSGDYAGVAVLPFYLVYRAMVRAKVALIRARQMGPAEDQAAAAALRDVAHHLADAAGFAAQRPRALVLTGGVSGSGKTTLAQSLLEALGALRLRSDVERKRLHGLAAAARSTSGLDAGLYAPQATRATYARLATLAEALLPSGFPVIADATFLHAADRSAFMALGRKAGARCTLLWCDAPLEVLRERITARAAAGGDASEATLEVLAQQLETLEPPQPDADTVFCDSTNAESIAEACSEIARRCASIAPGPAR
jgi:aminoglycoside phosphotransferase family enzyme/predicted kinase